MLAQSIDRRESTAKTHMKSKGHIFDAGTLTTDVAKMLPKPKGLPVVAVLKIDKGPLPIDHKGVVVFAESREMYSEDIEGLTTYL